jgi:mRNA guanylyltransferase
MPQIPELPGVLVARHSEQDRWVKGEVSRMCGVMPDRYVF